MTVKTSISLTDEQEAYARSLVAGGRFPSVSAVLQRGLDMLRRDDESHQAEIDALRVLIVERRSGPFVPLEETPERLLAAIDREE